MQQLYIRSSDRDCMRLWTFWQTARGYECDVLRSLRVERDVKRCLLRAKFHYARHELAVLRPASELVAEMLARC